MTLPQPYQPQTLFEIARSKGINEENARSLLERSLRDKKETTRRAYKKSLDLLAEYCAVENATSFLVQFFSLAAHEANALLMQWRLDMQESGLAPNTINQRLAAVRFFASLGRTLGLIDWTLEVKGLKVIPYRDTQGCGVKPLKQVLDSIDNTTPQGRRDELIFRLLFGMALRRSELASLDWGDIDFENKRISILGKGRLEKEWMSFDESILVCLRHWKQMRLLIMPEPETNSSPLLVSFQPASRGQRLTDNGIYRIVQKWGNKLGVRITPHGIRHTAITEAIDAAHAAGIGVEKVRDFSRHKDIRTLFIYQDRVDNVQGQLTEAISL